MPKENNFLFGNLINIKLITKKNIAIKTNDIVRTESGGRPHTSEQPGVSSG